MPPAPSGARISNGPSLSPAARGMICGDYTLLADGRVHRSAVNHGRRNDAGLGGEKSDALKGVATKNRTPLNGANGTEFQAGTEARPLQRQLRTRGAVSRNSLL